MLYGASLLIPNRVTTIIEMTADVSTMQNCQCFYFIERTGITDNESQGFECFFGDMFDMTLKCELTVQKNTKISDDISSR